jgi:arylsulfatase
VERRSPDLLDNARIPQVRCNGTSACGAEGVLLANGGAAGGYSFYVKDGKLHYTHSYVATDFFTVSSKDAVPEGWHKLRFEFELAGELDFAAGKGSPGFFQLHFDGTLVGSLDVPHTGFTGYNH